MSLYHSPQIVKSGLVGYYDPGNIKSFPGSGTVFNDISASLNTGTIVNSPTYNSANGGFLTFNGTDQYIYTTTQFTNPQTFTVQTWFKASSSAYGRKIIGFESSQSGTGSLSYDRSLYITDDGLLSCGIFNSLIYFAQTGFTVGDNTWRFVSFVYSSAAMNLYVGTTPITYSLPPAAENYNGYWRIGGYKTNGWTTAGDGYFPGDIGPVLIYTSALNASQVTQNYNALRGRYGI